jgi:hypothetical protein
LLVAKLDASLEGQISNEISLTVDPQKLHVFDVHSGVNIGYIPDDSDQEEISEEWLLA